MRSSRPDSISCSSSPLASSLAPLALACSSLGLIFWGFAQSDWPLILFIRTLRSRWLDQAGDMVNRLGDGEVLVLISVALLIVGLSAKDVRFRDAGIWSLIAHAAAGLAVQSLKHLIGRPRPRFTHGEEVQLAPSLASGLDSFPSGHAAASFAVAVVLAKYFPRLQWLLYGLAALVGASRVVRGSHFATDVAVGATVGLVVGLLIANPRGLRRRSVVCGLVTVTPYMAACFAIVWIAIHPHPGHWAEVPALAAGAVLVVAGVGGRIYRKLARAEHPVWLPSLSLANGAILLGLALSTGSPLIMGVAVLAALAWWLAHPPPAQEPGPDAAARPSDHVGARAYLIEVMLAVVLCLALAGIQSLKGILPLL